jgi:hypothetical protein
MKTSYYILVASQNEEKSDISMFINDLHSQ